MAGGQGLRDQVRLVPSIELVAKIFDVTLDGSRRDPELLSALLGREARGDAFQDFHLALGQSDEIFLLPLKIHHASPW
jgi:hypothetical protein